MNAREMWKHQGVLAVLLGAAAANLSHDMREYAIGALNNLAEEDANRREMWEHVGTRVALVNAAAAGVDLEAREYAIDALQKLAEDYENVNEMREHTGGVRAVLLDAAAAEGDACREMRDSAQTTLELLALAAGHIGVSRAGGTGKRGADAVPTSEIKRAKRD